MEIARKETEIVSRETNILPTSVNDDVNSIAPSQIITEQLSDDYNPLNFVYIPTQQTGIWTTGSGKGFLYQDFQGIVWKIENNSLCHLRDAARATGIPGKHWHNTTPPKEFNFENAQLPAYCKKIRYATAQVGEVPNANPGTDKTIIFPEHAVLLDATGSSNKNDYVLQYLWNLVDGPDPVRVKIDSHTSPKTLVTFATPGVYTFGLKVTNRAGLYDVKQVRVTALEAQAPAVAKIGDQPLVLTLPVNHALLDASSLPTRNSAFAWEQLAGPTTPAIAHADKALAQISGLVEGKYEFQVTEKNSNYVAAVQIIVQLPQNKNLPAVVDNGVQHVQSNPQPQQQSSGPGQDPQSGLPSYATVPIKPPVMPYAHSMLGKPVSLKKNTFQSVTLPQLVLMGIIAVGIGYALSRKR